MIPRAILHNRFTTSDFVSVRRVRLAVRNEIKNLSVVDPGRTQGPLTGRREAARCDIPVLAEEIGFLATNDGDGVRCACGGEELHVSALALPALGHVDSALGVADPGLLVHDDGIAVAIAEDVEVYDERTAVVRFKVGCLPGLQVWVFEVDVRRFPVAVAVFDFFVDDVDGCPGVGNFGGSACFDGACSADPVPCAEVVVESWSVDFTLVSCVLGAFWW